MTEKADIYKAGGVIIRDRKLLLARARGKDVFVAPGGKLEPGESAADALIRELREELEVEVWPGDLESLGTFRAQAAGNEGKIVEMEVMQVKAFRGEPTASSEIEELLWANTETRGVNIGSIFEHDVMPMLKERGEID